MSYIRFSDGDGSFYAYRNAADDELIVHHTTGNLHLSPDDAKILRDVLIRYIDEIEDVK